MIDPLSDVLHLLNARSVVSTGMAAGKNWAVRVPAYDGLKFNAIVKGAAWLMLDGDSAPIRLEQGDCFLLTKGLPFVMASDLALIPVLAEIVFANAVDGLARMGEADAFEVTGGKMQLDAHSAELLIDALPAVVVLPARSERARMMQWLLDRFVSELRAGGAGSAVVAVNLMHLMFIELIRAHLAVGGAAQSGWLAAQADPRIGRALYLMHEDPAHNWTLAELAAGVAMSRSSFANHFKALVGLSPLNYLTRWRLHVARRELRIPGRTIAQVAETSGYSSESAFGHAFKRTFGLSPRRHLSVQGKSPNME